MHALDVGALAAHVLLAHVDDALEPEACADGRSGDSVLAGAGLGHDALLAETACEHRLPERVVQLVRSRVEEVLPFEVQPLVGCKALSPGEGRRSPSERSTELVEVRTKRLV